MLAQMGSSGFKRDSVHVTDEWHPKLQGTKAVKIYREMADNDAVIGGALWAAECLIRQAPWEFAATKGNESSPAAKELADWCNTLLGDMEQTWQNILSDILLMLPFGWCLCVDEIKIRRGYVCDELGRPIPQLHSAYDDGMYGWRNISIRAQETLHEWDFDKETSRAVGMWQRAAPFFKLEYIPLDRALLFRHRNNKGSPEGKSALRNSYREWFFKKRIEEYEAIGVERDLAGLPVMQLPVGMMLANADTVTAGVRADYETKIQKIRRDQLEGLCIPSELDNQGKPTGYKFGLVTSGGRRPIDVDEIIKRKDSRIGISLFAEFLLLGQDKVGSFSMHSDKTALFAIGLGAIMDTIVEEFNRAAMPRLMRLNGIDRAIWPQMRHGDVEKEKAAEIADAFSKLVAGGIVVPTDEDEAHARSLMDWPQRSPEDRVRTNPADGGGPASPGGQMALPFDDGTETVIENAADEMGDGPDFWTAEEVAAKLGVSRAQVNGAIKRGQLPGVKIGNTYRVSRKDAERLWSGKNG